MMKKGIIILLVLLSFGNAKADYIDIYRTAYIYSSSNRYSSRIDKVYKGDKLILLNKAWKNGFYYVKNPDSGVIGWINKSDGRRRTGSISDWRNITKAGDLIVDILDVGNGVCNIITLPDGRYIIYDAGHYRGAGKTTYNQILEIITPGSDIELMVLSHTDADHIGAASHILKNYRVKKLLHTGYEKSMISSSKMTGTYSRFVDELNNIQYPIEEINLNREDSIITPGSTSKYGEAELTFLSGFGQPLKEWELKELSKKINAVSIVMKIEYKNKSVLFGGDAVGKFKGKQPVATEHFLVNKAHKFLDVDVVIAPHHGADNGSSNAFIKATSPQYVIFCAGHGNHGHPYKTCAERYLNAGVKLEHILRTDRGDDEEGEDEWKYLSIDGCIDPYGDDDIRVIISNTGNYSVSYINEDIGCE